MLIVKRYVFDDVDMLKSKRQRRYLFTLVRFASSFHYIRTIIAFLKRNNLKQHKTEQRERTKSSIKVEQMGAPNF